MSWTAKIDDLRELLTAMAVTDTDGAEVEADEAYGRWVQLSAELRDRGRMLYMVGNGASASMACHFSADVGKNCKIHTQVFTDPSLITAMSNDISYEESFAHPLGLWGKQGDMLIAISSSGKSPNILAAVNKARELGITAVTLSAMGPDNPLRRAGDLNFYVAAGTYGNAETCHATILHHWVDAMLGEVAVPQLSSTSECCVVAATPGAGSDKPFHFVNAVWGAKYVDFFLDVVLPNDALLLREFCEAGGQGAYRVLSVPADLPKIEAAVAGLRDTIRVDVVSVDDLDTSHPHYALSHCHQVAVRDAAAERAIFVCLAPDALWTRGSYRRLLELHRAGKTVVLQPGVRVVKETFVPAYRERWDAETLPAPRELASLAMQHLHPISRSLFWDSPTFSSHPSHLYWQVGGEGLLARCFHLHPVMADMGDRAVAFEGTFDDDFVERLAPRLDQVHIVEDSDETAVIEISDGDFMPGIGPNRAKPYQVAVWAQRMANGYHRHYLRRRIRFHGGVQNEAAWQAAEAESDRVVEAVQRARMLARGLGVARSARLAVDRGVTQVRAAVTAHVVSAKSRLGIEGDLFPRRRPPR